MKRLLALISAGWLGVGLLGQPAGTGLPMAPAVDPVTGLPLVRQDTGPKFEIKYDGGTPEDLIEIISSISKVRPNVVIHPDCRESMLPSFRLRDVTAAQVFHTLNTLGEPNFPAGFWRQVPIDGTEVWTLSKTGAFQGMMPGMFPGAAGQPAPAVEKICKVFNLGPYLETFNVEDITTAVQGAWDLLGGEPKPNIKYHKDTKLLIVVGNKEQIALLNEVLLQLRGSIPSKSEVGPRSEQIPTPTAKTKTQ